MNDSNTTSRLCCAAARAGSDWSAVGLTSTATHMNMTSIRTRVRIGTSCGYDFVIFKYLVVSLYRVVSAQTFPKALAPPGPAFGKVNNSRGGLSVLR
jgi:hypothetical protein